MRRQAREDARRIALVLVAEHDAERVWLFGSAVGTRLFHEWSDIDMAADGPHDYGILGRIREEVGRLTRFELDLLNRKDLRHWDDMWPTPVLLAERGGR